MILRIVKMSFQPQRLADFHTLFDQYKSQIRHFPGCEHLELHADALDPALRYTYSYWRSLADLEHYRQSELFRTVWPETKQMFADRPQAFSLIHLETIEGAPQFGS